MSNRRLTWLLEKQAFPNGDCVQLAALNVGLRVIEWCDDWWSDRGRPVLEDPIVFHGSLENADRIARLRLWTPGAYCHTERFHCSKWYPIAAKWLLHERWEILSASQFVAEAETALNKIGVEESVFVRPDSPLKPFSGPVLPREKISLAALDHGFYYDDPEIGVVVAPVRQIKWNGDS